MADEQCREEDYSDLKDLWVSLDREGTGFLDGRRDGFSLCLWVYLLGSARPSSVILRQIHSANQDGAPFLALSQENKLMLFPLIFLHDEAPSTDCSFPWNDIPHISATVECPLEKWVHVGCEVAATYIRLFVDGTLMGEKPLAPLSSANEVHDILKQITLVGNDGNEGKLQGYVYNIQDLPASESISDHFTKNPPVKLSLDASCLSDGIEEGADGVWSIVGGKASCRRNFSLDVVLLDALGRSIHKEMEIVSSLVYADNGSPVEKLRDDAEAPLLASCDGLELPSAERPVSLLRGRATFKLKISQLSSKSDNRMFQVCFQAMHAQSYPFLEVFSRPIRCISRIRSKWTPNSGKKPTFTAQPEGNYSPGAHDEPQVILDCNGDVFCQQSELNCVPSLKRLKLGHEFFLTATSANGFSEQEDKPVKTNVEAKLQNFELADSALSDSESTGAKNSESDSREETVNPISDAVTFKYCLEGTYERSVILKEIIASASHDDMFNFAEQVCLYAGCSHHRYQIMISKQLVQEGASTWRAISRNSSRVLWTDVVPEIDRRFMSIAHSPTRGLSGQDLEVLRGIGGCGDELGWEDFDRIWHWLYPVAFALSKNHMNMMWQCMSPKWIEGLITREEAENSLKCPGGLQKPGTFVLRFPTSRGWPHPDAGSLVVTYVGTDFTIHQRLLSIDHSRETDPRPLQDLLLEEPELTQLGRVTRQVRVLA